MVGIRLLLVATLALCLSGVASAQQRATLKSVDQRLTRVENVLDQSLLQMLQRIDTLQQQNRLLSGEVESLRYELEKQQQRSRELYKDTDRRIGEIETRPIAPGADGFGLDEPGLGTGAPGLSEPGLNEPALDELQREDDTSSLPTGQGGSSTVYESSTSPRFVPENNSELVASNGTDPLAPLVPVRASNVRPATQAEKAAYTNAYNLLAGGDNPNAIIAFEEFLRQYPDGPFSDNAWYWQGEARYAARAFDLAQNNFNIVVNSFPESAKVPDSRLKIGYALYEQGSYIEARNVLTAVQNDYAGRSASVLARKRLQKMNRDGN